MITAPDRADLQEAACARIEHIAGQPGAQELCRALAWSEGFSFQVAVCDSAAVSTALQLWLATAVPAEREQPVTTERISPYPFDWREREPSVVDTNDLIQSALSRLMGAAEHADLIFLDAVGASPSEAQAWRSLFGALNQQRNVITRDVHAALTFILPPPLVVEFARKATDFWTIRSLKVDIADIEQTSSPAIEAVGEFSADDDLLRSARAGDQKAAAVLFRRHAPILYRHLELLGAPNAEDLAQNAFLALFTSRKNLSDSIRGFLLRYATAWFRAQHRRDSRQLLLEFKGFSDLVVGEALYPSNLATPRAITEVMEEVSKLPAELQEIVRLRLVGLSFSEIASVLDLPRTLVRRRHDRALDALKRVLQLDEITVR